jgi:hypothetical protein
MTPWYPATAKPARDGAYLRAYTGTPEGGWHLDYWLSDGTVGFWYVNDPKGQWNDACYSVPWRGLTRKEYLNGEA